MEKDREHFADQRKHVLRLRVTLFCCFGKEIGSGRIIALHAFAKGVDPTQAVHGFRIASFCALAIQLDGFCYVPGNPVAIFKGARFLAQCDRVA